MRNLIIVLLTFGCMGIFSCGDVNSDNNTETITLASCNENYLNTKAEITSWKDTIYSKLDLMAIEENKSLEMLAGSKVNPSDTIQVNIVKAAFNELEIKRNYLKQLYQVVVDLFTFDETKFNTFKTNMEAGSLTDEEIEKELKFYMLHFDSYQNDITTWKSVLNELEIASTGNRNNLQKILSGANN